MSPGGFSNLLGMSRDWTLLFRPYEPIGGPHCGAHQQEQSTIRKTTTPKTAPKGRDPQLRPPGRGAKVTAAPKGRERTRRRPHRRTRFARPCRRPGSPSVAGPVLKKPELVGPDRPPRSGLKKKDVKPVLEASLTCWARLWPMAEGNLTCPPWASQVVNNQKGHGQGPRPEPARCANPKRATMPAKNPLAEGAASSR